MDFTSKHRYNQACVTLADKIVYIKKSLYWIQTYANGLWFVEEDDPYIVLAVATYGNLSTANRADLRSQSRSFEKKKKNPIHRAIHNAAVILL